MSIPVSVLFDESVMGGAQKWHWRKYGWLRWVSPPLGVLIFAMGVRALTDSDTLVRDVVFLLSGTYFLLQPWILEIQHRRSIRKSPYYGKTISWQIEEHQISAVTQGAAWTLTWDKIHDSVATPEGLLIYLQKNTYYWFPKAAFRSEQEYEDVKRLIASVTKHRELK